MLNLDLATVLWQTFNFVVFFGALYYLLFRPVMRSIRARAAEEAQQRRLLEEDRAAAATLKAELEQRLANAEEEVQDLVSQAQQRANQERLSILQDAHAEVERLLTEAQVDVYRLKRQAIDDFHEDLLGAITEVSSLVVGRVSPPTIHDALVQEIFDSVWEMGRSDMARVDALRRSLGERTPTVMARTARKLTAEQQGHLVRTFSALADRNINLDVRVEPALGLGMEVRLGDLVVDNTIAGKLNELRETVAETLRERVEHE